MQNWEIAYWGHVHGSLDQEPILLRFESSLDRLNLRPRLEKNKPRWKEDEQRKSQQKGR